MYIFPKKLSDSQKKGKFVKAETHFCKVSVLAGVRSENTSPRPAFGANFWVVIPWVTFWGTNWTDFNPEFQLEMDQPVLGSSNLEMFGYFFPSKPYVVGFLLLRQV